MSRVGRWSSAGGRPSGDAGHEAGAQPPHHDQPGNRNREQVGRDGGHRQSTEAGEHHRRHADLGGQRDGERFGERRRTGQANGRAMAREHDARATRRPRDGSPTESTRNGSTRTSAATARASKRIGEICRPSVPAVTASPAITAARRTDGSPRVTSAKKPMAATVTAQRPPRRSRRSSGERAPGRTPRSRPRRQGGA